MSVPFTVALAFGPHAAPTWTLTADSRVETDNAAGVWVLDGYKQSWTMPEDWPAQPEPASASFTVAAVDPVGLPPMEIGTPISATVTAFYPEFAPYGTLVAEFYGRVTDAVAKPTMLPTIDGPTHALTVDFVAVDYLADLREDYIAAQPFPEEYPNDRVARIWDAAGITPVMLTNMSAYDTFRALDVDHRTVADVLEEHLAQVAQLGVLASLDVTGWRRPIVVPLVTPADAPLEGAVPGAVTYAVTHVQERATLGGGPVVLEVLGGVLSPVFSPSTNTTAYKVLDGDVTATDVEWRKDKGKATNRVLVSGEFAGLFGEVGPDLTYTVPTVESTFADVVAARGPITVAKDSTFAYYHSAKAMADMYLGDPADSVGQWGVESVTLYASELPAAEASRLLKDLFPAVAQGIPGWTDYWPYGYLAVVTDLLPAHRLTGRPWLAGAITGADLDVMGGDYAVTVHMRPSTPRQAYAIPPDPATYDPAPGDPVSCATLRRDFPTVTFKDKGDGTPYVDPTLTSYDARLIRSE